jgi:hypothetical protein
VSVSWGKVDFTTTAQAKYDTFQRNFTASNDEWGSDGWPGYTKTLTMTYEICNKFNTLVAIEGNTITMP